jgi:nitronate monooxygenase
MPDNPLLRTRLTEALNLNHPVIGAPMAFAAGGDLASAISQAGGLGMIGGGYGDPNWIEQQFAKARNHEVGCGFITWALRPEVLSVTLAHDPKAVLLSFGDPSRFAPLIKREDITLICQVQTRRDAMRSMDCGADIIVAQGSEAGGHGEKRGTMALVPEIADLIAKTSPKTLLCAAGGIVDGRGLAAALMLGADGILIGSRFWASKEAEVSAGMHDAALRATGDDTIRSQVMDIARKLAWPERYTARVLKNAFIARWHGRESDLLAVADHEAEKYRAAWAAGDPEHSNTFVGEGVGLIDDILPAADILHGLVRQAADLLASANVFCNYSRL